MLPRLLALLFFFPAAFLAQEDTLKHFTAKRTDLIIKIDGKLDDPAWAGSEIMSDFIQRLPIEKAAPTQKTEVRILYDDQALYVGAMMYDTNPDSILHQLGNRDSWDLNADEFEIFLDTYNSRQDGFSFSVSASGVQGDSKFSDYTYNAIWESSVKITQQGWVAEIKIPYSAIRFPKKEVQEWGLQVARNIKRNKEWDQWAYIPSGAANYQKYFGTLHGISKVEPPVRLSFSPYLSGYYESAPGYDDNGELLYGNSFSYNAGADIKYGINESFTLDLILFPDFGQVQSDNKIKTLSYREITYSENRGFFKEGTELFRRYPLFYSRRIGQTPGLYYSIPFMVDSTDEIIKNPSNATLLNAVKLSGRSPNKLGIGILNAVTAEMNAVVEDSAGIRRKIQTEPLTNYNVTVFDQQLKNNSSIYFLNTNVMRSGPAPDANVSAAGYYLENKKNSLSSSADMRLSQVYTPDTSANIASVKYGHMANIGFRKIGGQFEFGAGYEIMNKSFDPSDLGYQQFGDYGSVRADMVFMTFKPGKIFRNTSTELSGRYSYNLTTGKQTGASLNLFFYGTFLSYISLHGGGSMGPWSSYDYYEPRVEGRYYRNYEWWFAFMGFSSDYRKKLTLDGGLNCGNFMPGNIHGFIAGPGIGAHMTPRYRISDKWSVSYSIDYNGDPYNPGFADIDTVGIIFGARKLQTITNSVSTKYTFKNDLSLSIVARHYWTTAQYVDYFLLGDYGHLLPAPWYQGANDFSFTAFNVDAVFSWQFAPGSNLSIVYKNAISNDSYGNIVIPKFFENLSSTFTFPQTNTLSVKAFYYLDYLYLKKKKNRK